MKQNQKTRRARLFTLAALLVVLMSNVYVGRAVEEPFEIVWKKDIGRGIGSYPLDDFQNFYVASDKTGNFLVYKDDYHSLAVLDLITGEFKNRIDIEMDNDKEIKKFRLLKNNTRLAVWGNNGWIYIFDTQTWSLERKFQGYFENISEDMTFLVSCCYAFYDYNTLDSLSSLYADVGSFFGTVSISTILSQDSKRLLSIRHSTEYNPTKEKTRIKVFDLSTYKEIFVKEYDGQLTVFADDSINNVFVIGFARIEKNDLLNGIKCDTIPYYFNSTPPYILSKNKKFLIAGDMSFDPIKKNYDTKITVSPIEKIELSKEFLYGGTLADAGDDYIISWIPADSSNNYTNYLCKIKINDQEVVPVLETEYEPEILYPNPTNSVVIIPNIQLQNISELKVFDEKGSDLSKNCQINILPSGVEINMRNLMSGIYFIQINNSVFSKSFKVIKN